MRVLWKSGEGGGVIIGSTNVPTWAKWCAIAIGAPLTAYALLKNGVFTGSHTHPNDFDRFLVSKTEHPTGLPPPSAAKKKKKKSRSKGWWNWGLGRGVAQQERGKVSGPFETFLKVEEPAQQEDSEEEEDDDHRDPVDFNSFLKAAIPSGGGASQRQHAQQQAGPAPPPGPKPDQARVLVMYGTEFGFSKEIAEKLCAKLRDAEKYWPVLENMAEHPEGFDFTREQALLIACSTQGDGVPPTEPRDFCEWLMAGKAGALSHLNFSVCALGDKSYQHYCRCGKLLDAALASAGATCIAPRQDVNREDWAAVNAWMDAAVAGLDKLELQPVGEEAAAALGGGTAAHAEPKAKRWGKSRPYPARVVTVEPLCNVTNKHDKVTVRVEVDTGTSSGLGNYIPGDSLGIYALNSSEAVEELLGVMGVNGEEAVPVPSWHYTEDPDEEGAAASPQGMTMPLREALQKCYDLRVPKAELFHALWAALPESAQQRAQGSDQGGAGLEQQASSGDKGAQAAVLARLLAGGAEALDAYFDYTGRHVSDVLRTFPSAHISLFQLLGALRALQPRLYSISSSPLESAGRVQATIAEVRYEAFGKPRAGVASAHVSSCLKPGDRVRVYIHKNPDFRLPQDPTTPIIMVGPGTGLAPFRAFILHRLLGGAADDSSTDGCNSHINGSNASSAVLSSSSSSNSGSSANGSTANGIPGGGSHTDGAVANGQVRPSANSSTANGNSNGESVAGAAVNGSRVNGEVNGQSNGQPKGVGQMVLFFGCRRRDQDYLYGRDLDSWAASGTITLFNAFSREQEAKVYVQDRLREQADLVWDLIHKQGAHFYVCGDASSMAGAVEKELMAIFAARLAAPGADAAATTTPSKKAAKKKAAAAAKQAGEGACLDGTAAAQQYLEGLSASGRYQRDVWYT